MSREEILMNLKRILFKVLNVNEVDIDENTKAEDVEGWDSLKHIVLISELEREFKVKLPMRDVVTVNNVGGLLDVIAKAV